MKTMVFPPTTNEILRETLSGTVAAGTFADMVASHGVKVYPGGGVSGDEVEVYVGGVYRVTKAAGSAWVAGTILYLEADNVTFGTTAGAHQIAGFAAGPATSAATTGLVKLVPQVS